MSTHRHRFALVLTIVALAIGLSAQHALAAQVIWRSKLLLVTKNHFQEPGPDPSTIIFQNPVDKTIYYACGWSSLIPSDWNAYPTIAARRLGPHREAGWDVNAPSAMQCAAKKSWPALPLLSFSWANTPWSSSNLQVLDFSAGTTCGDGTQNCGWLWIQNRVHSTLSVSCTWQQVAADGTTSDQSWQGTLYPYLEHQAAHNASTVQNLSCTVT